MTNLVHISDPIADPTEWIEQAFDGHIVIFRDNAALAELASHGRNLCEQAFETDRPDTVVGLSSRENFLAHADGLDTSFNKAPETAALFNAFFQEIGLPTQRLFYDRWRLRTNPSDFDFLSDKTRHVPPHRDNWGSHLHCQLNWWGPLFDIEAQQSLLFYPAYWRKPIANDSDHWSLEALKEHRRNGNRQGYPTLPTAQSPLRPEEAMPLLLEPGEMACFSGAHLHGSANNRSGRCRFNIETRTISLDDMAQGRHAPNVDGPDDKAPTLHWFRNCHTGESLSQALSEPTP